MKYFFIFFIFITLAKVNSGQSELPIANDDTTTLSNNFHISAWGSEPGWDIEFNGLKAQGHFYHLSDSLFTFSLVDRIYNHGYTNDVVDSYIFRSSGGDTITLILNWNSQCPCFYHDGEDAYDVSAYLLTNFNNKPWMLLGCAIIHNRP